MQQSKLSGKHVLVVGMGLSGRSAVEFLLAHNAKVMGVDRDEKLLKTHPEVLALIAKGLKVQLDSDCHDCTNFDFLVLSPGVPPTHPLVRKAEQELVPIIGEIELGCRAAKTPMIGITGTNGKTTVTLLVTHVLQECGQPAQALGNVGTPFTKELLTLPSDVTIVLELSSYQIDTLYQPVLDAGLILNITPDHLDRYGTMEAYAASKCALTRCIKSNGFVYIEEKAWKNYGHLLAGASVRLYGYSSDCYLSTDLTAVFQEGRPLFELPASLKHRQSHELENFLAAYALCDEKGISGARFLEAFKTFKKPAHRIEFVADHLGIHYYDDSKGTNLDAVIRAVQSLDRPIVLIAGGVDKGAPYTPWLKEFGNRVKLICAIGQAAAKIQEQIAPQIPVTIFCSLEEAVREAASLAVSGDVVLLSPGCSSFDMFKDYAHRGDEFKRIVRELCRRN